MSNPDYDGGSRTAEVRAVYDWLGKELAKYACRITKVMDFRDGVRYWTFTEKINPHLTGVFGIEDEAISSFNASDVERRLGRAWPGEALHLHPHGFLVRSDGSVVRWAPDDS